MFQGSQEAKQVAVTEEKDYNICINNNKKPNKITARGDDLVGRKNHYCNKNGTNLQGDLLS
jgi:hypothetical protein